MAAEQEILPAAEDASAASDAAASFYDPGAAVHGEVERGLESMVEQHTAWLELLAANQRGEEYDWRTAELLSCIRSIEWDLQDLDDHVSIVEGNRSKFADIDDDFLASRKELIDSVRRKIDGVREGVQEASQSEGGHAAAVAKASLSSVKMATGMGRKGGSYNTLKEEYKGAGCFGASSGAASSAPPGDAGGGGGAAANASASPGLPELPAYPSSASKADKTSEKAKPWYLCCC